MSAKLPHIYVEIYQTMLIWDNEWLGYEAMAGRTGYSVKELKDAIEDLVFYPAYIEYYRNRDKQTGRILGSGYRITRGKRWAIQRIVDRAFARIHTGGKAQPTFWQKILSFLGF